MAARPADEAVTAIRPGRVRASAEPKWAIEQRRAADWSLCHARNVCTRSGHTVGGAHCLEGRRSEATGSRRAYAPSELGAPPEVRRARPAQPEIEPVDHVRVVARSVAPAPGPAAAFFPACPAGGGGR